MWYNRYMTKINVFKSLGESWRKDRTPANQVQVQWNEGAVERVSKIEAAQAQVEKDERGLEYIVVHHAPNNNGRTDWEKVLEGINREHEKFTKMGQPLSGTQWENIAYHDVIIDIGDEVLSINTRDYDRVGYHAGNIDVNVKGRGICVIGNFAEREVDPSEESVLFSKIDKIKEKYPGARVGVHNDWRKKGATECSGVNLINKVHQRYGKPSDSLR